LFEMNPERYLIEEGERWVAAAPTFAAAKLAARENIEPEGCRDAVLTIRRDGKDEMLAKGYWNAEHGVVTFAGSTLTKGLL
jgi:hypothetical protein